jgi:hypothetical protein
VTPRSHADAVSGAMVRAWRARGTAAESFITPRPAGGFRID